MMFSKQNPRSSDDRLELTNNVLNVGEVYDWATIPSCGAVVVFSGIVRDHADGRKESPA